MKPTTAPRRRDPGLYGLRRLAEPSVEDCVRRRDPGLVRLGADHDLGQRLDSLRRARSRISFDSFDLPPTHSGFISRDRGPLSPPTIAQWIPVKLALFTEPISGSNDTKRMAAAPADRARGRPPRSEPHVR
jgi:hypothetical protein